MRLFIKTTAFLLVLLAGLLCTSWIETDARLLKKMDKQISSVFKINTLVKQEINIQTEENTPNNRTLYRLLFNDTIVGYALLNRSYGCRVGGCAVYSSTTDKEGNYDPFYYSILTDQHLQIKNVQVLEYFSEYGYEITNKNWLAQFVGTTGRGLVYGKDVDAISGATISVKALLEDIDAASVMLHQHISK